MSPSSPLSSDPAAEPPGDALPEGAAPLVFAGIDEAGYGPMLGPLCLGCTVFVLDRHDPAEGPPNLWRALGAAVCRRPTDRRKRVAVDDSKKLKGPLDGRRHPLRHLERGVLCFLPGEAPPATDEDLFALLGAEVAPAPWFASRVELPVGQTPDELSIARSRVRRALAGAGIRCAALRCRVIDADAFNRSVRDPGSKAGLNLAAALDLVAEIWRRWPEAHPRVVLDRHGGRTRYGQALRAAFEGASVEVVAERPTLSRYLLRAGTARLTVSFALGGDGRFLPVALASMTAKLTRELFMVRMNRYFGAHLPELKPTAGYVTDARRFLREIEPVILEQRIERRSLVRAL